MAIIVGSVAVDVVPNISNFTRDAKAKLVPEADKLGAELGRHIGMELRRSLQAEIKRMPNIQLGADDRQVKAKVAGARRQIQDLGKETAKPQITPNLDQSRLDKIKIELGSVAERAYDINFDANDKRLVAKMSLIKARLEELNNTTARANLDLAGAFRAEAEIAKISAELDEFGRKKETATLKVDSQNAERGMRRLIDLAIGFAPAIVQTGVIAGGVLAAIGSSAIIAGAGIGLVAKVATSAAALMKTDLKQLQTDNAKLATAQAQLDNAKGPKARAAALKKVAEAQAAVNSLTKAMGPAEAKMLDDTTKLKDVWHQWLRGVAIPGLQPLVSTLKGELPALLRDITPLFRSAAGGIHGFEVDLFHAFRSPFWQQFFDFLGKRAGPTIRAFGRVLINSVTGLAGLIQTLDPLGQHYIGTLEKLTARFANFGKSSRGSASFQSFLQFVRDNGPIISNFIGALSSFMVTFAKASAGVGIAELDALTGTMKVMSSFAAKHPQMAAMAVAVFTLSRAVKALKLVAVGGWIANLIKLSAARFGIGALASGAGAAGAGAAGAGGAAAGAAGGAGAAGAGLLAGIGPTLLVVAGAAVAYGIWKMMQKDPRIPNNLPVDTHGKPTTGTGHQTVFDLKTHQFVTQKQSPGAFSIPPSYGKLTVSATAEPPLEKHGKKITIPKSNIYIPPTPFDLLPPSAQKTLRQANGVARTVLQGLGSVFGGGRKPKIPVAMSVTGAEQAALRLANVSRVAKGLPKIKSIKTLTPGAQTSATQILNLNRSFRGIPARILVPTNAPGAKLSTLQLINLSRAARGLPPLARIPTATPGAVGAKLELINLDRAARGLPPLKKIPTHAPGAVQAALDLINLHRRADGLPPLKKIPTSVPGADPATRSLIELARRAGLLPPKKDINTNAPGAAAAKQAINDLKAALDAIKGTYAITVNAGGHWSADQHSAVGGGLMRNADGGPIDGPGGPKQDNLLSWVSNGEWVHTAAARSFYGDAAMDAVNKRKAIIIPRFAEGGGVGLNVNVGAHGLGAISTGAKGLVGLIGREMAAQWKKYVGSLLVGGGSASLASWIPAVAQALSMLGQSPSLAPIWVNSVIKNESGGNPAAVNLTDSNAQRGTPSVGGNQVIGPTFAAYAGPFRNVGPFMFGVSINKLANSYAALAYDLAAYGSILGNPGISSLGHGGGYRPYANGGPTQANVPMLVGERGPEVWTPRVPGYVTPNHELGGNTTVRVFIGNEEIRDIARVEVQREGQRVGERLVAGRRVVR